MYFAEKEKRFEDACPPGTRGIVRGRIWTLSPNATPTLSAGDTPRMRRRSAARRAASDLGPLGRDERDGTAYQLQEAGAPKAPADVVAARADIAVCRTSRELPAGHFIERRAEHAAAKVGSEAPPDQRVAQILLPEAPHFLVEVVAIRLRTIGSHPDAKPRVGGLDLVQHLPRAPVLSPATAEVEVGEGLGDRPKGRFTSGPTALAAGAFVPGQAAPVEERALREVSQVQVATAIQVGEKAGEHPEHEVWGQMDGYLPVAALEPGQPLRRRATAALATLAALARRHAGYTEPITRGRAPLRVPSVARQDTAVLSIGAMGTRASPRPPGTIVPSWGSAR